MEYFQYQQSFELESGQVLPELTIAYHTYGQLNASRDNVIWICHALTANSEAADWWPGMIGEGLAFDTSTHFIVCANILGSCYGSTGPLSNNPRTGKPYYQDFPWVTMRDIVRAQILLRQHLDIARIELLVGGSIGGYQALEWAVIENEIIDQIFLLATSPAESAWGIAVHTTQRLAIEADTTWLNPTPDGGAKGLKAARAIGMLTYRNYEILVQKQSDEDVEKVNNFKAASYIEYQGEKLVKRFNAYSYWMLTKSMDSHNIARGRAKDVASVLRTIRQPTLIIGIDSDILCPVREQRFMAAHMPNATLAEISSAYGHDGFLVEAELITKELKKWKPSKLSVTEKSSHS